MTTPDAVPAFPLPAGAEGRRVAAIIGGGPAGLTAALELARRSDVLPVVLEAGDDVGGLSRTVVHNGNRMDIGGHRFFSKSAWVTDWWQEMLPEALLERRRLSRIYYLKRFFDYPVRLSAGMLRALGPVRTMRIAASYLRTRLFPRPSESSLEDFLINRFGRELYRTFFQDYTEKVWGIPCAAISAEWGAQRIKGLSVGGAVRHALRRLAGRGPVHTSLIERFLYPVLGPGQLWQRAAERVRAHGGVVALRQAVTGVELRDGRAVAVRVRDEETGAVRRLAADWVISSMPVCDLVRALDPPPPPAVTAVAAALPYRDFITVGLLLDRLKGGLPPDTWIYVQEPEVRLARIQVFNNWSPGLVADPSKAWLGLEYFCQEGDDLWRRTDAELAALAAAELDAIGLAERTAVLDTAVVRVPKAYPAYVGAYRDFAVVRGWLDAVPNLFLVGRNGMHRYNNQDHSMLTAKLAAEAIATGSAGKDAIWAVNVGDDYHEEQAAPHSANAPAERLAAAVR